MGFLLSAFDKPAKLTAEIITAEIKDIIFRIYSPFLILSEFSMCLSKMIVNYTIYIYYVKRFIKMSQTTLDIKEPGLNVLPPGVERHVVNAGGLTGLQIFPDDEIEIINEEGNQICEIICFDKDGKSELGILNQKENCKKSFIKELLKGKDESSLITNLQLKKRNLDINKSKSSILFDEQTPSGEKIKIKSKDKCYAIFAAPQNDMLVSEQNPSSDITIFIKRYKILKDLSLIHI